MSEELLNEINKATQDKSEAGKDISYNEAEILIQKIEKTQNKSPELEAFLDKVKLAYNTVDKQKEDYKKSLIFKTGEEINKIKAELEIKAEEEDKKLKEDASKIREKLGAGKNICLNGKEGMCNLSELKNQEKNDYSVENIRKNLLEYLENNLYNAEIKELLKGLKNKLPDIFEDLNFARELLNKNEFYSIFIDNPEIVKNIIENKKINTYFVLTQETDKLKIIIKIISKNGLFDKLIQKSDIFIKNVDPEIQKYILELASKSDNTKLAENIFPYMHKFDRKLIQEELKNKSYNKTEKAITEYLNRNNKNESSSLISKVGIELGIQNKNETLLNELIEKKDTQSIQAIVTIIINNGGYIDEKINMNYLSPIKTFILDDKNKFEFNIDNASIIKSLNNKNEGSDDYKIVEKIQNRSIDELFKGNIFKNSEYITISLEKGFPIINKAQIIPRFKEFDKLILKLMSDEEDKSNISQMYELFGEIGKTLKAPEYKDLLKEADEKIKRFTNLETNKGQVEKRIESFYNKNKKLFKKEEVDGKDLTLEKLKKIKFTSFDGYLKQINPYLETNVNSNNFNKIADLYEKILDSKIDENNEKSKEYFKNVPENLKNELFEKNKKGEIQLKDKFNNKLEKFFKKNKKSDISLEELKNIVLTLELKEKYEKLDNNEKTNLDELLTKIIDNKKIDSDKNEFNRVKNSPKLKNLYINYANGKIDEKSFQEQKTEINKEIDKKEAEAKKDGVENHAQIGAKITKDGTNYFITDGEEKFELSPAEVQEVGNDQEKIKAVLKFKNEMDDLGLGFLWKDREILFQNVKNAKGNDSINIFDGNITVFEMTNLLEYIYNGINKDENVSKKESLKDYRKYFEEIKLTKLFNDKDYSKFDDEKIFIEIFKKKGLFNEGTFNLKKDI